MLSFEDFFIKKKIDLSALQSADQILYDEFKSHYSKMGEKSFDHSKKFWFNKLRKSYLLQGIEQKKTNDSEVKKENKPLQEDSSVNDTSIKKPIGFKTKFKAVNPQSIDIVSTNENKVETELSNQVSGFKPRFKTGITKKTALETTAENTEAASAENKTEDKSEETSTKPAGFKPRFKAGITKATTVEQTDVTNTEEVTEAKTEEQSTKPAGFKPRFKAGLTKAVTVEQTDVTNTEGVTETKTEEQSTKPTGFKPRFKAGITKSNKEEN